MPTLKSGFHADDYARERPRRQLAVLDYYAMQNGKDPLGEREAPTLPTVKATSKKRKPETAAGEVPALPAVKAISKKRKPETAADDGPTKRNKGTAKGTAKGAAVARRPSAIAVKLKAPARKPSKAKATQKAPASPSTPIQQSKSKSLKLPKSVESGKMQGANLLNAIESDDDLSSEPDDEEMEVMREAYVESRQPIPQLNQGQASPKMPTSNPRTPVSGAENRDEDSTELIVILKVPDAWFTKKGKLRAAFAKKSGAPKRTAPNNTVPKKSTQKDTVPNPLASKGSKANPNDSPATSNSVAAAPKIPRTPPARRAATMPRTPAAPKPTLANTLPTPPAEAEDRDQEALELEDLIDPEQLRLSRKLVQRSPIASKPAPQGSPQVWADSRQALCETVPYFKMPQSGCHQNDGHVYAFLYDGAIRCREYMDTELIISGAGGGMEPDSTGQLVQKKNHTMGEAQVKAVLNDIEHKNPLVIICGNKSEGAICKMPYRYNVLGWFKPTAVWAEKTMGKKNKTWTTIRYRFERLDQAKVAWNAPKDGDIISEGERQSIAPLLQKQCQTCSATHPMVYLTGWMCLSPDCDQFWKFANGKDAPYGDMPFNPAFLIARTPWAVETEPFSVKPPVLSVGSIVGDNLTQINTRGMCCPNCGRCNSRRLFKGWKCENTACAFENFPKYIPVQVPLLHQPWESTGEGPSLARNKHDQVQGVELSVDFKHGFKVYRYSVPGIDGALIHLVSNTTINKLPGGANEMFDAMQREDLHLERRRFGVEKMSGGKTQAKSQVEPSTLPAEPKQDILRSVQTPSSSQDTEMAGGSQSDPNVLLSMESAAGSQQTQPPNDGSDQKLAAPTPKLEKQDAIEDGDFMTAFSMNYGMPYKFVANGASLPFRDSPWPVRAARADLNWASQTFLDPGGHEDLNEELIFAYLEGQKLEYHDDGEEGLGPRIATLSLGGKAKMHLRMKMKHYTGCSKTGLLTKERPVPGSIAGTVDGVELTSQEMYEKRLAAWEELQQLTDRREYNKRAKEIPIELGLFEKRMKKADDLVTVTLNHGDIVLMEGYDIQKYLEHKVVPEQCLRFALTCRTVLANHLKPEERPSYGAESDEEELSALRRMVSVGGDDPRPELKEN